jgi:hypothetical protein
MSYWIVYFIVLILGFILGFGLLFVAHRYLKQSSAMQKLVQNITLSLLTLFFILMISEIFFKVFFAQSDAWNQTLASQNWFKRYWATNSMGYRDVEWSEADLHNKKRILVLGDSFAAGHGIENIEDRFSDQLGAKLGDDYLVMNIAASGISTKEEIDRVTGFPYKPEIFILQYFINDIRYAANEQGFIPDDPSVNPPAFLKPLVDNSYVINFISWHAIRLLPGPWQADDFIWLNKVYNDPNVWWFHQQELLTIYEGARSEQVQLIVVIFPSLTDVDRSSRLTAKVIDFFKSHQVPVLDVAPLVQDIPLEQRIVSSLDAHPSVLVHHRVAEALYEMVMDLKK